MSSMTPGLRTALIAGGIAVVVGGGGVAAVWAADQFIPTATSPSATSSASPTPSPSQSTPGQTSPGKLGRIPMLRRAFGGAAVHGEFTVKNKDGSYSTIVAQRGTVQSVSDSNITVKSDDGFTQAYAINSSTTIVKVATSGAGNQGRRLSLQTIKASDLKAGDTVGVSGTKSGTTVTANRVVSGTLPTLPNDHGRRMGYGSVSS
ncbi:MULTISPECIES: hypothetical protein [Arthrobacter]|uniref:DUF5666 domain-containing protein n=1 Tax=Arthrobacter terricola TaxID=2547396 RepID=A0A4R5L0L5_9MICC|nr:MULTISPECIES: hypothetical protein [Arthrobacter]MBT8160043.1 hypothetical protein [Arthrobacter sp. GN70]TDG01046.1 hypothetical protein E1809_03185 [Arthrobacter terricola]